MKKFTTNSTSPKSEFFSSFVLACIVSWLIFFCFISCARSPGEDIENASGLIDWSGAFPAAILQPGEHPLWFRLTDDGPVHIEAIEDTAFSCALVPWPYALHVRFMAENKDEIIMTVNRYGFLKFNYNDAIVPGFAMYRFSGGDFWRQYTVSGFLFHENNPAAILYLDSRFISTNLPLPQPRAWTFNMSSNNIFPLEIPALQQFPGEDGWGIDSLRLGSDGLFYYRAAKRRSSNPEIRMFRTGNLAHSGEEISAEVFFNSAPQQGEISHPSLPPLPQGFVYTGIGQIGSSLFASWEEQQDFSIGAAGFVVILQ
jgi:hypothetical protein